MGREHDVYDRLEDIENRGNIYEKISSEALANPEFPGQSFLKESLDGLGTDAPRDADRLDVTLDFKELPAAIAKSRITDFQEAKSVEIYIHPPTIELNKNDELHSPPDVLLVLPDGNERGKLEKKTYNHGGEKVTELAEVLARQGKIKKMVACILSPENIKGRPDQMKEQIETAFRMLKHKIETDKKLIRDGIRLETYGDLDEMADFSHADRELKKTIEKTCEQTHVVEEPKLRLVLGVNYGPNIARDLEVNLIYRSGLEPTGVPNGAQPKHFRSSGIKTHAWIKCFGSTTLWPDEEIDNILTTIDDAHRIAQPWITSGHSAETIREMMRISLAQIKAGGLGQIKKFTVPFEIQEEDQEEFLKFLDEQNKINVEFDRPLKELKLKNNNSPVTFRIVDGKDLHAYSGKENISYDLMVVPGQESRGMCIPEFPNINYANVFASGPRAKDIMQIVREAMSFINGTYQLKGTMRQATVTDLPEFSEYAKLQKIMAKSKGKTLEDIAIKELMKRMKGQISEEKKAEGLYNIAADIFVAELMDWANEIDIKWPNVETFRAFTNYGHTGFFFCYYPNHPLWGEDIEENWHSRAWLITKDMILTAFMDDLFDAEATPEEKKQLCDALINAVQNRDVNFVDEIPPHLKKIHEFLASEFNKNAIRLEALADPDIYQEWEETMIGTIKGMDNEFKEDVVDNPLLHELAQCKGSELGFAEKYLNKTKTPPAIFKLIDGALHKFLDGPPEEKNFHYHDLKLFAYLLDIEKSIGSGKIFKALMCIESGEEKIPLEARQELDMICSLLNIIIRIANDLAEKFRGNDDHDKKIDVIDILSNKYEGYPDKKMTAEKELMNLFDHLKTALYDSINKFHLKYMDNIFLCRIAIALQRARIGELFYKGTHYRKAKRGQVRKFFDQLKDCGMYPL